MKGWKKIILTITLAAWCTALFGCASVPSDTGVTPAEPEPMLIPSQSPTFTPHDSAADIADRLTMDDEVIADFSQGAPSDFYWSNGYSNGNEFNCTWSKNNASVENGVMSMSVSAEANGYAGAEYRTNNTYSYGFYSVCMKAAGCSGIISSFFTYTYQPVWDEIDIEFLGKDTSEVQFNYFTNGTGGHEYLFDLGFDASEEFHEYAFDWQSDSITWYVDGVAVYRATENIPSHPMQIMMNVWNPVRADWSDGWSGRLDETALPATAQYKWFAYAENY